MCVFFYTSIYQGFGAVLIWTNVDQIPCGHMVSFGHNESV